MDPHVLLSQFESLGDTCEFGFVQRHFGLEPISLLRWAGTPLDGLTRALISDFEGFFAFEHLGSKNGLLKDETYGISFHSPLTLEDKAHSLDTAPDPVRTLYRREATRITYLVRRFRETLAEREKIFVYKSNLGLSPLQMLQLKSSLDLHGPQRLLCVVPASPEVPAGQVDLLASGLKLAGIARLAHYDCQEDIDAAAWLSICEAAAATGWAQGVTRSSVNAPTSPTADTHGVALIDRGFATSVYTALYRSLLLREPDEGGLVSNVENAVTNGLTLEDVVAQVVASSEYQSLSRTAKATR